MRDEDSFAAARALSAAARRASMAAGTAGGCRPAVSVSSPDWRSATISSRDRSYGQFRIRPGAALGRTPTLLSRQWRHSSRGLKSTLMSVCSKSHIHRFIGAIGSRTRDDNLGRQPVQTGHWFKYLSLFAIVTGCQLRSPKAWAQQDFWEIWLQPDTKNPPPCSSLSMSISQTHVLMFAGERLVLKSAHGINVVMRASEAKIYRSAVQIDGSTIEVVVDMSRVSVLAREPSRGCQWSTPPIDGQKSNAR